MTQTNITLLPIIKFYIKLKNLSKLPKILYSLQYIKKLHTLLLLYRLIKVVNI